MIVYLLQHIRKVEVDAISGIHIGVYTSLESANLTIDKYKNIEGFKDYPDDFVVEEYEVVGSDDKSILPGESIYFLQHEHSIEEDGIIYDYVTDIDMFMNYVDAEMIMEELKRDPKYVGKFEGIYSDNGGFCIDQCILNKDNWTEGFVTWC